MSLLYKIKQFYSIIEKVPTMSGKLTWSHWNEMLSFDDIRIIDFVKNHIHIRNSNKKETISEKILQKLILEDIPTFLKE